MKILGFVHAGVVVEDINKAIEFYNGVLGLEVLDGPGEWVTDFNETRAMGLGDVLHRIAHLKCADGSQVELIEFENSRDLEGSDMSDYNGKEHMSFLVDDIQAYVKKLAEYGLHPLDDVQRSDWCGYRNDADVNRMLLLKLYSHSTFRRFV